MSELTDRLNQRARISLIAGAVLALAVVLGGVLLAANPPLLTRLRSSLPGYAYNTRGCHISPGTKCPYYNLSGANLSGAPLMGADLSHADLSGADLAYTRLSGADLTGANLQGADLTKTDLDHSNLTGVGLAGRDLAGRNLTGVTLTGTDLTRANLTGADLTDANVTDAILFRTTMPDGSLGYANTDRIPVDLPPGNANAFYQLRPRHVEGMCQSGNASGTASEYTMIWTCSNRADDKNQQWQFVRWGIWGNYYQIKIGTSGYCLDVEGAATTAGATLLAHACMTTDNANDNAHQLWRLDAMGDGGYRLVNKLSGLCAAPKDGGRVNDTVTVQLPCTSDPARLWGLHMQ